jgi:Ca-activated chloride channel family protein
MNVHRIWPAVAVASLAAQLTQDRQVFRSGVQTVAIYATVNDREGRLVPDLPRDAFTILDNGQPSPVTLFSNDIQPITVVMLLDMSGSMNTRFLKVRDGTLGFIDALLPADRVRLGSFGTEIALSPLLTGDKATLARICKEEMWPGGGTPMWNAVFAGMKSLAGEAGRRVVLVLTDGYDTGDLAGWRGGYGDSRRMAERDGFMFYAIGMEGVMPLGDDLVSLVEDTGGGHFHVKLDEDLTATFARVADELRHQYLLGFTPKSLDGKTHKLEVRAGPGTRVRARKSYVAEK